jgi:hypothetical protein
VSLDFIQTYGGRRMRTYPDQPLLDVSDAASGNDVADESIKEDAADVDFELPRDIWRPIEVGDDPLADDETPRRFVDGSNVHEAIAWIRSPAGYPVPVVMAELGGICVAADGRELSREFAVVERTIALAVDAFPWHEVEAFATALLSEGLRLLAARPAIDSEGRPAPAYDFERQREQARVAVLHEMAWLEEVAWGHAPDVPTVLDGRLGRFQRCNLERFDVIGVIKQQRADYLHPDGWRTLYQLEPGERTPAFVVPSKHLPVVSWYLKLAGADGELPNWGIVRVEIPRDRLAMRGDDFGYLNRLSRGLMEMRCRASSYSRGPVSLEPIVRAEDSLKSLFTSLAPLARHFYRLAGI